jgi:hypothetical protein
MNTYTIKMTMLRFQLDCVTESSRLCTKSTYPQKLLISRGLTNLESNSRSRLEVDWLFFARDDYITESMGTFAQTDKNSGVSHLIYVVVAGCAGERWTVQPRYFTA